MRRKTNRKVDKKIFSKTAQNVKAINLPVKLYRGGIRL